MKTLKPDLLSVCIAAAVLMMAPQAHAQDPAKPTAESTADSEAAQDSSAVALDTITVTARGVAEALQKMPLPITAITSKTIENKGYTDIKDIASATPGFSFRSGFGRGLDRPVIRGMSNIQGEPNASFFLDGIYIDGDVSGYGVENLERVEVIRGPQAAAFGRRTFSGAINYITKRPGSDPGGKVTIGMGSEGQYRYSGNYSGGSEDGTLGYDVSFINRGHDGLFYNSLSGRHDLGGTETTGMMGSLLWAPTDKLQLTARLGLQRIRDQHFAIARLGSDQLNCYLPEYTGELLYGLYPIAATRRKGYICGTVEAPTEFPINTEAFKLAGYMPGRKQENLRSSVVADYSFDNYWTLTSTSAYNETSAYNGTDQDYSGIRGFGGGFETFARTKNISFSQDLRLITDQSKPVYGMLGAYYFEQNAKPGYTGTLSGFALGGVATSSVVPIPTNPQDRTVNKAIYGLVNWDINDRWTASLEARYAEDELSAGGIDTRRLSIGGVPQLLSRGYSLAQSYDSFTPRATLSYQVRDNVNLYGLVSKGNKPGGFNLDVQRADFTEELRAQLLAEGRGSFDEETSTNYEFGVKTDLLDGRLRLNANLFYIDWKNQQLTESRPVTLANNTLYSNTFITNIGAAEIRGLELESQWNFADGWLATLAYAYTDAEIVSFVSQDQADLISEQPTAGLDDPEADASGNKLPRVPKNKLALGLMYEGSLANGWGWMINGDAVYESSRFTQIDNLLSTGSSTRANFRVSLDPSEKWRFTAYVNNAFDDDTPEDIIRYLDPANYIAIPALPPASGYQLTNTRDFGVTPTTPRMYGVEVSYRF